jgi:hypothetical protein
MKTSIARLVLGTLLTFFALLAFAAGYYGVTLGGYVVTGLLLFFGVGGVFTAAALTVLTSGEAGAP